MHSAFAGVSRGRQASTNSMLQEHLESICKDPVRLSSMNDADTLLRTLRSIRLNPIDTLLTVFLQCRRCKISAMHARPHCLGP